MKNIGWITVLAVVFAISSCSSEISLQQYYITNADNPNFMSFDVPVSLLNLEKADLDRTQREAVSSLKKLNILAFLIKNGNVADYEVQKATVKKILKGSDFRELIKMNTEYGKGTIQVKGDDEATIDEIVIYGDNDEKGFLLIRVLGVDMTPSSFVQLIQAVKKSDFKGEGLEQLENFIKG